MVFIALLHNWTDVHAEEEYDEMKYKTVASFEEFEELYMSNDTLFQYTADEFESVNEIWYIDIEEPGWFIFSTYNAYLEAFSASYNSGSCYVYPNTMFMDAERMFYSVQVLNGEDYKLRTRYYFFLTKGRYYLKLKGMQGRKDSVQGDKIVRVRAYFIPGSIELKIDNISYNDDYSQATVLFTTLSDNINTITLYDREVKTYDEMISQGSHSIFWYKWGYDRNHNEKITQILSDGIEIDKNGTYSLVISFNDDEYKEYNAVATFTIDKIGAEANDIEAKSVKMSKTKATLKVGETVTLKATIKPKDVTDKTVTWKSSNKKVATVDKNGKVTAKKKGTCTITAVTSNGKKAKCKITVKK